MRGFMCGLGNQTRLGFSIIAQPLTLHQYTVLVSMLDSITILLFHYTGHAVLKMPFQGCNSLALHQRTIKDADLVMDKLPFH